MAEHFVDIDCFPDAKTSDPSGPETLNCGTINTPPEIQGGSRETELSLSLFSV